MTGTKLTENTAVNPLRLQFDRRLSRAAGPSALVIFGVTGDLAKKKLLPAIYDLANRGLLPPGFGLVGFARRQWDDDTFRQVVREAVEQRARTEFREEIWEQLAAGIRFVEGTFDDAEAYARLNQTLADLDRERGTDGNHAFYLSIPPRSFPTVCEHLSDSGLADTAGSGWRRVVIEKPFGSDLETAIKLNETVESVFPQDSIFRIDHYLGKETVQNIMALRFGNMLYEPIWNSNYVDHVQITMAEDIGIGSRAGYYDGIGAARDVIQNHLLQLLAITAMEEPVSFDAGGLRVEKEKVLRSLTLPADLGKHTARGQYLGGWQGGEEVKGFFDEDGIGPDSETETFAAMRVDVNNRRWAGTPFYLRAGKRLGRRVTEVALVFKAGAEYLFGDNSVGLGRNALVIRIQPDEGVTQRFGAKLPGNGMNLRDVTMDFGYGHSFTESSPEAYERLILDMLLGEPPLFPQHAEVELSWKVLDPVEEFWATQGKPDQYRSGTWGPESADEMMARDGRAWRRP